MQSESRPDISIPLPSPKDGMLHFDCFTNISSALHGSTSKGFDAKLHWAALRTSIHLQLPCPPIPSLLSLSIPLSPPPRLRRFFSEIIADSRRLEFRVVFISSLSRHFIFSSSKHRIQSKSSQVQVSPSLPVPRQSSHLCKLLTFSSLSLCRSRSFRPYFVVLLNGLSLIFWDILPVIAQFPRPRRFLAAHSFSLSRFTISFASRHH